jgi:DDE family transposase
MSHTTTVQIILSVTRSLPPLRSNARYTKRLDNRLSVWTPRRKKWSATRKNAGRIWGQHPEIVNVHDFPQDAVGRAVPYGVSDLQHNCGTVSVGQSGDTAAFAVDNLVQWCQTEMPQRFPKATTLFICASGGGSNNSRGRLWKQQLQEKIADG